MRERYALVLLMLALPTFAPIIPPIPEVKDDRESIRIRVGHVTRGLGIQSSSNIMAGILELESGTAHRTNRDPTRGVKKGHDDDLGTGQVVIGHEKKMKKIWGTNFSLTNLSDNIRASCMIFYWDYNYYRERGHNHRQAVLRAIQSYNCGKVGRTWESRLYRRRWYMYQVLKYAENQVIPQRYR